MTAIMIYLLIGVVISLACYTQRYKDPTIPWSAFADIVIVWPYTLYLISKKKRDHR